FLGAHGLGAPGGHVPQARLLGHLASALEQVNLPLDFVLQGVLEVAEGIQVLHLSFGAEVVFAAAAHAHVGVAAQRALLHVAVAHLGIEQHLLQGVEIGVSFLGRTQIGLGNDFDERNAAAVEVNVGVAGGVGKALVHALGRVVFQVQPGDADALGALGVLDFQPAGGGQRQLVHRDLIAFRKVGVEVI